MVYFNTTYLDQVCKLQTVYRPNAKSNSTPWAATQCSITSSFFVCKFFNVVKRSEVKDPLHLIVMVFLGVLWNEITDSKTLQVSKQQRTAGLIGLIYITQQLMFAW
jgi:hypothetical protein